MDKKTKQNYNPSPVITEDQQLPDSLITLIEFLAQNAHENWSKQRIKDGWQYGKSRDDEKKYHPCLVPYKDLSEKEKEYDRIIATETIKVVLKLGFEIIQKKTE